MRALLSVGCARLPNMAGVGPSYKLGKAAMAYWGIGLHLGRPRSQNAKGHLLGHVRDIGLDPNNPTHRKYATNARQVFHTDSCDVVGLLCLKTAMSGGLSSLTSSVTLFNELLKTRPDIAQLLAEPWYIDRKGEVPPGKGEYYQMPIQHHHDGVVSTIFARDFIDSCIRFPEVPAHTPQQKEALDYALELANSDDLRLDMELRPGDMQFIHNHQLLHARTAYVVSARAHKRFVDNSVAEQMDARMLCAMMRVPAGLAGRGAQAALVAPVAVPADWTAPAGGVCRALRLGGDWQPRWHRRAGRNAQGEPRAGVKAQNRCTFYPLAGTLRLSLYL